MTRYHVFFYAYYNIFSIITFYLLDLLECLRRNRYICKYFAEVCVSGAGRMVAKVANCCPGREALGDCLR